MNFRKKNFEQRYFWNSFGKTPIDENFRKKNCERYLVVLCIGLHQVWSPPPHKTMKQKSIIKLVLCVVLADLG